MVDQLIIQMFVLQQQKLIHLSGSNIATEPNGKGIAIEEVGLRPGEKMYEELLISGEQQPTINPKIFKSKEKFPAIEIMNSLIEEIKQAIDEDNHLNLINIFIKNVEGYKNGL